MADEIVISCKKKKPGKAYRREAKRSLSVIVYADDLIVLHESEEIVLKAKTLIAAWLKTVGLELKSSKTRVSHTLRPLNGIKPGFDFLGFTIRQYPRRKNKMSYKTIIKPSLSSIKQHALAIKHKLREMRGVPQGAVIKNLNPIIRGWCQYYVPAVSSKIFSLLNSFVFRKVWKWAVYRHPNKGKYWIKEKYFKRYKNDNWRFMTSNGGYLIKHGDYSVKRHIKVVGTKSLYDGDWVYWSNRLSKIIGKSSRVTKLLKLQQGKCKHCHIWFRFDDFTQVHHQDRNRLNNDTNNLLLLHKHCHDQLHGSMYNKHQIREKPDVVKITSPVLKSRGEGRLSLLR